MTHEEFFERFCNFEYRVGCFTKQDHDAFIRDFLQVTGRVAHEAGHLVGYDIDYPYLYWARDHIAGSRLAYRYGEAITYEDYVSMVIDEDVWSAMLDFEEVL